MPSGAALLGACIALLVCGVGDGALLAVGLGRLPAILWAALALSASPLNLPTGSGAALVNPGGALIPLLFCAFLVRGLALDLAGYCRLALAATAAGLALAGIPAWAEQAGVGWPAILAGAACAALAIRGAVRQPREVLTATAAALAVSAALRYAAGTLGLAPLPPSLGGGPSFDAGVLAVLAGQVVPRLPLLWRTVIAAKPAEVPHTAR